MSAHHVPADCSQVTGDDNVTECRQPTPAERDAIAVLTGTTPTGRVRMKVREWATVGRVVAAMNHTDVIPGPVVALERPVPLNPAPVDPRQDPKA
jgi:hypothetical protein